MLASGCGTAKPNSEFINGIYGNSIDASDVEITATAIYFGTASLFIIPCRLSTAVTHIVPVIIVSNVSIDEET